jgi:hypothetical protein
MKKISDAIDECWDKKSFAGIANKSNCSGLVKCVGNEIGVKLTGQANDIVDHIKVNWSKAKDGVEAKEKSEAGKYVIAGVKDSPNGHVVIVVPGGLDWRGKYPTAAWGTFNGLGEKKKTLNWAFPEDDRKCLTYAYTDLP